MTNREPLQNNWQWYVPFFTSFYESLTYVGWFKVSFSVLVNLWQLPDPAEQYYAT